MWSVDGRSGDKADTDIITIMEVMEIMKCSRKPCNSCLNNLIGDQLEEEKDPFQ